MQVEKKVKHTFKKAKENLDISLVQKVYLLFSFEYFYLSFLRFYVINHSSFQCEIKNLVDYMRNNLFTN